MVPDCNLDLHSKETVLPVMIRNVIPWAVTVVVLLLVSIAIGSLVFFKVLYKYWTITSAEILVKVALIPDVQVKVVHKSSVVIPDQREPRRGDDYLCFDIKGELFLVHHDLAPFIFALGCLFAFTYIGVFFTEQWKLTSDCSRLDPLVMGEKICFNYPCPNSINCDAWNEAGKREMLLCWSPSINLFRALTKFVALVVFQVTLMRFLGLFIHGGCPCDCLHHNVWKQYLSILAIHLAFVVMLLVGLVVLIVVGHNSMNLPNMLINFILPFAYMLMVAVLEVFALGIFVHMLRRTPPLKQRDELPTLP